MEKSLQGLINRTAGAQFEQLIDIACDYYWARGCACIEKTPEPMAPIRPYPGGNGQFIAYYTKQAQPDYKGVLCDGTCIIFDAKHTKHDKIQQKAVSEKQTELLNKYEKMGAKCYIVVSLQYQHYYRVPWHIWRDMKDIYGRKHMKLEDLEKYRVPYKNGIVKFLEGVELR